MTANKAIKNEVNLENLLPNIQLINPLNLTKYLDSSDNSFIVESKIHITFPIS